MKLMIILRDNLIFNTASESILNGIKGKNKSVISVPTYPDRDAVLQHVRVSIFTIN